MPCTRLRKSLQVGQAQRRKSKHQNREEKKKKHKREMFRKERQEKPKKPPKKQKIHQPDIRTGHTSPATNKRVASHICLLFVLGSWLVLVSIIKQQGVITCHIDQ